MDHGQLKMVIHENLKRGGMKTKICTKCRKEFPATVEFFYKDKYKSDGLASQCKSCFKEYTEANKDTRDKYRSANKNKIAEYRKEYGKKYYKANKDKVAARQVVNRDKIRARKKKHGDGPATFKVYGKQLNYAEDATDRNGLLEVACKYCGKRFLPTVRSVANRISALNGAIEGESRLYCSDGCKSACSTFGKSKRPDSYSKASSRESNPVLRQLVLKRDNWTCRKCGSTDTLHCHHVIPARQNPFTANDPDACVTLCKKCHKDVHKQDGCKYHELRCP